MSCWTARLGSAVVWRAIEMGKAEGVLSAHVVTTVHYFLRKELGAEEAKRILASLLRVFDIAAVDGPVGRDALRLAWPDFEDAVTASAARVAGCQFIITRDPRGFPHSPVRVLEPEEAAPFLE